MVTNAFEIKTAKRLGEVQEYYFSRKLKEIAAMRKAGKAVLNLGIGSPDLPPEDKVVAELIAESQKPENHAYQSYSGIPELCKAFAGWYQKWFGVELDFEREILPLIGSKEGIMHIAMTYLEEGDEVLIPNPGYPAYRAVSKLAGAGVVEYLLAEKNAWLPDLQALEEQDLTKVKIMWVNYPNMPTGAVASKTFFEELVAFAKKHQILVVNDNPYSFILNDSQRSILAVEGAKEVALELNSLSKSHNMAGWRIGMLAGKDSFISDVLRFKSNMDSGMFKPLQLAGVKALQNPPEWYEKLNFEYRRRRKKAWDLMNLLECKFDKQSVGMFVWAKIPDRYKDGFQLSDEVLQKAHVFLTPGGIFGSQGERYIRISLCSEVKVIEKSILRIKNSQ